MPASPQAVKIELAPGVKVACHSVERDNVTATVADAMLLLALTAGVPLVDVVAMPACT